MVDFLLVTITIKTMTKTRKPSSPFGVPRREAKVFTRLEISVWGGRKAA
jgi:hypothetical protein